jgi:putative ABC transport system substrate-binding protein
MNRALRRRLLLASGALLAAPLASFSQPTVRIYRVANIDPSVKAAMLANPSGPWRVQFLQAMRERGYVEGRNLIYDPRTAEGELTRIPDIVADLVRLKTDVIIVPHTGIATIIAKTDTTIPIISAAGNPVRDGLAQSLNRPGGNVTGLMAAGSTGVEQRRLQLLRELVPKARRVAFVATKEWWDGWMRQAMQTAASALGIDVIYIEGKTSGFTDAFAAVRREKPDAVFFEASASAMGFRDSIGDFALSSRIPTACGHHQLVERGCLMTYNFVLGEVVRTMVDYVDRILKGTKAGDLPIAQYTKYEFVINRKTAKAIGLAIPPSALLLADRVID